MHRPSGSTTRAGQSPGNAPPQHRRPVNPRVVRSPTMEPPGLHGIAAGSGEIARDGRASDGGASARAAPNVPSEVSGPVTRFTGPERPGLLANSGQHDRTT